MGNKKENLLGEFYSRILCIDLRWYKKESVTWKVSQCKLFNLKSRVIQSMIQSEKQMGEK